MHRLLVIFLVAFSASADTPWPTLARQMGRSEASRRAALRDLSRLPGLSAELRRALDGKQRYLALEVISALGLKELVPDLLRVSGADENGAVHLTLAALVDEKNVRQIETAFHEHLKRALAAPVPVVVQVILFDTLGRMGTRVDGKVLSAFFASPEVYVREAVLNHLQFQRVNIPSAVAAAAPKDPSDRIRELWKMLEKAP